MAHFNTKFNFILGFCIGIILAYFFRPSIIENSQNRIFLKTDKNKLYQSWLKKHGYRSRNLISWDQMRYSNSTFYTESQLLFEKINIFCVIFVKSQKNYNASIATWAKGCNTIKSINIKTENGIMPRREDARNTWALLCSFLHSIKVNDIHWLILVRDTTFVITENFRYYVAHLNPHNSYYYGHAVKFWGVIYNSAEAGYALSKGALKMFRQNIHKRQCNDFTYRNREDYYLGKYLNSLKISPINTIDNEGKTMFHPYSLYHSFYPGENYYKYSVYPVNCCSKKSISFQSSDADKMYFYYYLLYTLQIFYYGNKGNQKRHFSPSEEQEIWMKVLKQQNITNTKITSKEYYKLWEDLINDPNSFASNLKKESFIDYD